jgi:hypothetical protein
MATTIGPRELQLRQLAQLTRAGKNDRAPKPVAIGHLKDAMAKTSEAMVKAKPKKKGRRRA